MAYTRKSVGFGNVGTLLDRYDFAVRKISPHTISALGSVKYITEHEISPATSGSDGHVYLALGYPNTRNKRIDSSGKSVRAELWMYSSTAKTNDSLARKLGMTGADHLFIGFDKKHSKDSSGRIINSIKPKGASGGALFDLGYLAHPDNLTKTPECKGLLAGMLIEYHPDHGSIVATRIGAILNKIYANSWF